MPDAKRSYETIRIDLLPGAERSAPPAAASRLTRARTSRPTRLMESVARSRYQELLQSIYDAALITDLTGNIVDANVRAEEFFLVEHDLMLNQSIIKFVVGADETLLATLNENLKNERFTLIQAFCQRSDGTSFPAEIAVNRLRLDQLRLCFFIRDITRRTRAEELLRKEHAALHNAGCGILLCDMDLHIEYANPTFGRMIDEPDLEKLVNRELKDFLAEPAFAEVLKAHVVQQEEPWLGEIGLRPTTGNAVLTRLSAASCRDDDGTPVGIVCSFADVSPREQTPIALRTAPAVPPSG